MVAEAKLIEAAPETGSLREAFEAGDALGRQWRTGGMRRSGLAGRFGFDPRTLVRGG